MERSQSTGLLLIIGAALELLLFIYGIARRSYLAIALPVTLAMLMASALTFWLGWTMLTIEDEEDGPLEDAGEKTET